MDWLLKVNKKLYVVFLDDKNKSKIYKKNISNKIDSKYKYLKSFVNLEHKCYNQKHLKMCLFQCCVLKIKVGFFYSQINKIDIICSVTIW